MPQETQIHNDAGRSTLAGNAGAAKDAACCRLQVHSVQAIPPWNAPAHSGECVFDVVTFLTGLVVGILIMGILHL